jgi:hypothetical protein
MDERQALATTISVLVLSGLVGLVVVACVVAIRRSLPGHHDGGGPGARQPRPITVRPPADSDTELFRILDDARLRDLAVVRRARMQGGRPGAA